MNSFNELLAADVGFTSVRGLISAVILAVVCLIVIKAITNLDSRLLSKSKLDARVQKYAVTGLKAVLYLIAILIITSSLGIDMTSLVALLSVCSLGITLAAEDILGNIAGGIVILASHPFSVGDFIEACGVCGTVHEISLNHTKLIAPDGHMVMLPNKSLAGAQMTNYSVLGRRRIVRKVTASYGCSTEDVKAACLKAAANTEFVLSDPAASVYLSDYGTSSIEYTVFVWCEHAHYWDAYFGLAENLRKAFAETGVEMTYDHLNVHVVQD